MMVSLVLAPSVLAQVENQRETPIPAGPWRIAGKVVNAKSGSPLVRVRVTIADTRVADTRRSERNEQSTKSVITGEDGQFEFRVPGGKYSLAGAKRGFISAAYDDHEGFSTAIVTGPDFDTESLVLRLAPNAVLGGQVLDEFQEPVRNAQVTVFRDNHFQGISRIDRYRNASTDDEGRYEITPIDEGTYFISVSATPWYAIHPPSNSAATAGLPIQVDPALDVAYPLTYYGDSTEIDGAIPIPVRGRDRLEANIHLSPAPSLRLLVHVPQNGTEGMNIMLQKPTFDGEESVGQLRYQLDENGMMEISGIAAGRYSLRTSGLGGSDARESGEVDVTSSGELDMSAASGLGHVKIAVQLAGGASSPANMIVGLRNSKGRTQFARVDSTGAAELADVKGGTYDVVANAPSRAYSVERLTTEAGTVSGHSISVVAGSTVQVAATLVGGSVHVEGFAKRQGKAAAGAMIVLVPKNPEADHDRFRRDQSDLDGSFSLRDVIPGAYTVVAIDDGWELNWSEPAVIGHYLAKGQAIEVRDGETGTVRLEGFVEVQGK